MENILEIIYSYSKKKILLDKKAIDKIIEIFKREYNLDILYETTIIQYSNKDYHNKDLSNYYDGSIYIYLARIYAYLKKYPINNYINNKTLSTFERFLINNLFILKTVFHELEHAIQDQLFISGKNDTIEEQLSRIELLHIEDYNRIYDIDRRLYNKLHNQYKENYDSSFLERMADINSYKKALKTLESVKDQLGKIYEYEELLLLYIHMNTYKTYQDNPTVRFFTSIDKQDEISSIPLDGLDYSQRLKLGLNLSRTEYYSNMQALKKKIS